jgi:hypothetical protein
MLRGLNQLGAKGVLERFLNSDLNSAEHKDERQQPEICRQEHNA